MLRSYSQIRPFEHLKRVKIVGCDTPNWKASFVHRFVMVGLSFQHVHFLGSYDPGSFQAGYMQILKIGWSIAATMENEQWTFTTNNMNTFGTWIFFFHILGIIIPTDFHSFGWYVWSTSFKTRKPMPGLSPSQWFRLVTSIFHDGKIHMLVKSWFNCLNLVGGLIISGNHYWEIWDNTNENCEIYHNTMEKLGNTWLVVWNHGILWLSIQLGMSSSQLTNSIIFQRGRLKPPTSIYIYTYYMISMAISGS